MAKKPGGARRRDLPLKRATAPGSRSSAGVLDHGNPNTIEADLLAARLAGIIDSAMDAIITVGSDQRITLFNAAAEDMFRCTAAEALGQPLDKFIPNRFRDVHRKHVEEFGRAGVTMRAMGSHQRVLSALRTDGEEFPIEASISQIEVGGERLYTAIVRDVSAREQAQRALQEASSRFRTIFDHAPIGIMMMDSQGTILTANAALEKLLGYSGAEIRGMSHGRITDPADLAATEEQTRAISEGGVVHTSFEKRYVRKDGERVWAKVDISAVRDTDGRPQYFIKLIEDISAAKQADARIRRAKERHEKVLNRIAQLTDREREVMWLMIDGKATKNIASELGASPKTIDVHRSRVMEKMQADSVALLVQMAIPIRKLMKT